MEVLRNLFGSLTSGIIRLAVMVGIFAAAYFFFVKPTLDTVDHGIHFGEDALQSTNIEDTLKNSGVDVNSINKTIENANKQMQISITRSFHVAKHQGNGDVQKLGRCVQHAHQNVDRIQRCMVKFG